jgi:hypothetical protein
LTEAKADPPTRMDGVVVKGGSSWSHVELPRVAAPLQSKSRKVSGAGKIRGEINEEDEAREVKL